jgi:hypothetical protein
MPSTVTSKSAEGFQTVLMTRRSWRGGLRRRARRLQDGTSGFAATTEIGKMILSICRKSKSDECAQSAA